MFILIILYAYWLICQRLCKSVSLIILSSQHAALTFNLWSTGTMFDNRHRPYFFMVTGAGKALCYRLCKSVSPPSQGGEYEDQQYIIPETLMSFWLYRNGSYD